MTNLLQFQSNGKFIRMFAQEIAPAPSVPAPAATKPHAAVLFLHGAGGQVEFWTERLGSLLQQAGVALYAPHYFDQTGTTRADLATITDGVHVPQWMETVEAAWRYVAERPNVDPTRIVLAGASLGGFLALGHAAQRSAVQKASLPRACALIEISGGLAPPYDTLATPHMPPTLILHGEQDRVVPVAWARALDRKLSELGVPHQTELLPQEGHWFSSAALPRLLLSVSSFLDPYLRG